MLTQVQDRIALFDAEQVKMRELGVTTHADYRVALLMDHKSMVTVRTDKYGAQVPIRPE